MRNLIVKRFLAYSIDYIIAIIYASILFGLSMWFQKYFTIDLAGLSPIQAQVVGFLTLTLPVFLYFYLCEQSAHRATIGKRLLSISVAESGRQTKNGILVRNVLKFLPWELAHTGVHWVVFYTERETATPIWVWVLLIVPQLIVLAYIISIIRSKGIKSLYDKVAKTKILDVYSTR